MRLLGIDFGTSNTVGMVGTEDGPVRPVLFDGSPLLPSGVYLGTDSQVLVGRDAQRTARLDPSRFEPNPKRRIDDGTVLLGDTGVAVPLLLAAVLARVLAEASRQLGGAPEQVRLSHPADWGERRRSVLLEAARLAGMGAVRLVAEPVAAACYYAVVLGSALPPGAAVAIYDLGGGTFDAAVVRRTPAGFEVLAQGGIAELGGLDFDQAIVDQLGRAYAGADPAGWQRLLTPADVRDRRDRFLLYEDVRGAKEMLSRAAHADIHLPNRTTGAHLTRDELEALVRPYLHRTVTCLRDTIVQARLGPGELAGVFLVGGSSRIPLAAAMIHEGLGIAPTSLEQPEMAVVEGALRVDRTDQPPPRPVSPPAPPPGEPSRPYVPRPVTVLVLLVFVVAAFLTLLAVVL